MTLLLLLASLALAQEPSSGTAAVTPEVAPPSLHNIRAKLHKEAKDWEPVSLKKGEASGGNSFVYRQVKKGKTYKGEKSKAKSVARLYKKGDDQELVISVFPDALKKDFWHVELRFLVIEGFLEKLEVYAVRAEAEAPADADAYTLRSAGIPFQEEAPSEGALKLQDFDARKSKSAVNSGALKLAHFADRRMNGLPGLGVVSLDYSVKGVK